MYIHVRHEYVERDSFRFWPKSMDYSKDIFPRIRNSSLEGATKLNLHHSAPLEVSFLMVSFLAGIKKFRFWPKINFLVR